MPIPQVTFYDIAPEGRWPLFVRLAEAAVRKRKRLLLHCADADEARALDEHLWAYQEEAFLPHELLAPDGALRDPDAPVVIATGEVAIEANILLQATPTSMAYARGFEIVIDLVDHRAPDLLDQSRARFRAWREGDIVPKHVRQ